MLMQRGFEFLNSNRNKYFSMELEYDGYLRLLQYATILEERGPSDCGLV